MSKKSFFEKPLMSTKIKSSNVSLFPEAALGFLLGPLLALICNGVVNIWLVQYWDKVLGLGKWAPVFETILPIVSAIIIVIGNLFVGRLMERKPSIAGKARPLILLGMPIVAIALLVLFLVPFPEGATQANPNILSLVFIAVGYNLYYAIAWPIYYTSHSAIVSLSTRDGNKRGLLSTCVMAAQLGASGLAGMAGGLLVDLIGLLPKYKVIATGKIVNEIQSGWIEGVDYVTQLSAKDANGKWTILMAVMIGCLVIGCLLEYYFTRERITEEHFKMEGSRKSSCNEALEKEEKAIEVKKISMKEQVKICTKDKFWWLIIIFFFLYQFGGQMKNNDMSFYSQAMTGQNSLASLINTVGAAPTALGMVLVWPLAKKFSKSKAIAFGGVLAFIGAALGFLPLINPSSDGLVWGTSVGAFCVKALGTAPAMYVSLALMANVLDHQEAVHGVRTDGFTMAVYGSIMVAMSGVCNGIIVGLNSAVSDAAAKQFLHTFLAFGVEGICYLAMAIMFIFMTVEKFSRVDNKAIVADQKAKVLADGLEWIEPEERAKLEKEENERLVEEQRIAQLHIDCDKKHLNFDDEEAKYQAIKKEKEAEKAKKKAEAQAKKDAKEALLTEEQKAERAAKIEKRKQAEAENDAKAIVELNKVRAKFGNPAVEL